MLTATDISSPDAIIEGVSALMERAEPFMSAEHSRRSEIAETQVSHSRPCSSQRILEEQRIEFQRTLEEDRQRVRKPSLIRWLTTQEARKQDEQQALAEREQQAQREREEAAARVQVLLFGFMDCLS
jgi:hypothetical protein